MSMLAGRIIIVADAAAVTAYRGRLGDVVIAEDFSGGGVVTDPASAPTPIGGGGGFVPPDDNLTDLGDAADRFRSLWLGTSIRNTASLDVLLDAGTTATFGVRNPTTARGVLLQVDGDVQPLADALSSLGGPLVRYAGVYVSGLINNPSGGLIIACDGGSSTTLTIRNTTGGQVCDVVTDGNINPAVNNTRDLGLPDTGSGASAWRRLYVNNVQAPAGLLTIDIPAGGVGSLAVTNSGAGEAGLTVDGDITLNGASPTITSVVLDNNLRLRANGAGTLGLRDATDAATVLGVKRKFLVAEIDDETDANAGAGGDCTAVGPIGKAAIAVGQVSCVVTVAGLLGTGVVVVTAIDRDATAVELIASCGAGSFTVTAAAAATAKTRFNFVVIAAG